MNDEKPFFPNLGQSQDIPVAHHHHHHRLAAAAAAFTLQAFTAAVLSARP